MVGEAVCSLVDTTTLLLAANVTSTELVVVVLVLAAGADLVGDFVEDTHDDCSGRRFVEGG